MKKLNYFLSLLLLLLVGTGTAQAQTEYFTEGLLVTDISKIAEDGTKVVLKGSSYNAAHNVGNYLNCVTGFKANTITGSSLYVFEATGGTVDGLPTYRLKNDSTGLYLRAEQYYTVADGIHDDTSLGVAGSNLMHGYTSDVSAAYVFTACRPETNSTNPRTMVDVSDADPDAWVFAENVGQPLDGTIGNFGTYGTGFMSIYHDTNQWNVYTVDELPATDRLKAAIIADGYNAAHYVAGTGVGQIASDLVETLNNAYTAAINVAEGTSEEDCNVLLEAYRTAKAAAIAGIIMPSPDKYYFITDKMRPGTMYDNNGRLYATHGYSIPSVEDADVNTTLYMWKLEPADEEGMYYLYNLKTGRYLNTINAQSTAIPLSDTEKMAYSVTYTTNISVGGYFLLQAADGAAHKLHDAGGADVVFWNDANSEANSWKFTQASDELVQKLETAANQSIYNARLQKLYSNATYIRNKGVAYTGTASDDDDLTGKLPLAAEAYMSNSVQANDGGGTAALADGDYTTYFHSQYSGTAISDYVYVQIDLGQSLESLQLKIAKRHNNQNDAPVRVGILSSADGETWYDEGDFKVDYTIPCEQITSNAQNAIAKLPLQLKNPARYLRMQVKATILNQMFSNYPFATMSELAVYAGGVSIDEDPVRSYYLAVSEAVRNNFEAELLKSQKELAAQAATLAQIDALQAAYDALLEELPDPQTLLDAVAAARTEAEGLSYGTTVGYYTEEAKAEFDTKIEDIEATAVEGMSREEINAGVAAVEAALAALKSSLLMPEVGKIYFIRSATLSSHNNAIVNALAYANTNDEGSAIKQMRQTVTDDNREDPVNAAKDARYLWTPTMCENGQIVLRNLATGYYIGNVEEKGAGLPNVKEPVAHEITPANVAEAGGAFIIATGAESYMNYSGSSMDLLGWAPIDPNNYIAFEEVNPTAIDAVTVTWPINLAEDKYQVICLPFNTVVFDGTVYEVLGQKQVGEDYTLQLRQYEDVLQAGVPYLLKGDAKIAESKALVEIQIMTEEGNDVIGLDILDYPFAAEAVADPNEVLVGTIAGLTLKESVASMMFRNGNATLLSGADLWTGVNIAGNTGYVLEKNTEEEGDEYIVLPGMISSGIAGNIINASDKVDVYTLSGVKVRQNTKVAGATQGLPAGIYVVGGQKVLVK